jgi:putative ABC transport system permease protein
VEDIVRRVEALPGVTAAFSSNLVPLGGGGGGGAVEIDGRPAEPGQRRNISLVGVTPHFDKTMGVALLGGRDFTDTEGYSRAPVAVINQAMSKRFWPDGPAIDGRFRLVGGKEWYTVIGIAPDLKLFGVNPGNDEPTPTAFVPYPYQEVLNNGLTISVEGDPALVTSAVRREIRAADLNVPVFQVNSMENVRRLACWRPSGSTACCRTRCRSARRRSACASRSAPIAGRCCRWSSATGCGSPGSVWSSASRSRRPPPMRPRVFCST